MRPLAAVIRRKSIALFLSLYQIRINEKMKRMGPMTNPATSEEVLMPARVRLLELEWSKD
jgi:hypothetical protein